MKKILLASVLFITCTFQISAQIKLEDIINALQGKNGEFKNVITKVLEVNSSSNAHFYGGKTRKILKIDLPKGSEKWYYRITVLDIKSNYEYSNNEKFYYLLSNNKSYETYSPVQYGVDFYILGHSGDVESFLQTGNNSFRSYSKYSVVNTKSFIGQCTLTDENLWIGIKNPNSTNGLKVIIEVVAWGYY